jgi:hypothetical protein
MRRRSSWRWCRRSPPGARPRSTARCTRRAPTPRRAVGLDKLGNPACSITVWRRSAAARRSPASFWARSRCSSSNATRQGGWFALAGAVFTFFGLIHAEDLGIAQSPMVALSYLLRRRDALLLRQIRPRRAERQRLDDVDSAAEAAVDQKRRPIADRVDDSGQRADRGDRAVELAAAVIGDDDCVGAAVRSPRALRRDAGGP